MDEDELSSLGDEIYQENELEENANMATNWDEEIDLLFGGDIYPDIFEANIVESKKQNLQKEDEFIYDDNDDEDNTLSDYYKSEEEIVCLMIVIQILMCEFGTVCHCF